MWSLALLPGQCIRPGQRCQCTRQRRICLGQRRRRRMVCASQNVVGTALLCALSRRLWTCLRVTEPGPAPGFKSLEKCRWHCWATPISFHLRTARCLLTRYLPEMRACQRMGYQTLQVIAAAHSCPRFAGCDVLHRGRHRAASQLWAQANPFAGASWPSVFAGDLGRLRLLRMFLRLVSKRPTVLDCRRLGSGAARSSASRCPPGRNRACAWEPRFLCRQAL